LKSNPRYSLIKEYLNFSNEHQVENQINKEINENKKAIKAIDYNLKYIRSTQTKNDFLQIVEIADNDFNDY
jgi:uncharacterized protein YeeX (DUF496 family)